MINGDCHLTRRTAPQAKPQMKKPAHARNRAAQAAPIPSKLFAAMRIGVVGEFANYPSRQELTEFLQAERAQVESKVAADLDIVVLGAEGAARVQAQIRKANRNGASIRAVKAVLFEMGTIETPASLTGLKKAGDSEKRLMDLMQNHGEWAPPSFSGHS